MIVLTILLYSIYALLGLLALLFLLLLIPVHLKAGFDGKLWVRARYAFLSFALYPRPTGRKSRRKKKKRRKVKKEAEKAAASGGKRELSQLELLLREEGPLGAARMLMETAKLAGTAAKRALAAITVDRLVLTIVVAAEDAAETATDYGKVCAGVYPALAVLETVMRVRRTDIAVAPDFLRETGEVRGELRLHIFPLRLVWAGIRFFAGYLGNTIRRQAKPEDGEPSSQENGQTTHIHKKKAERG